MTEPSRFESDTAQEPARNSGADHPPFRMRDRRLLLLPDLRPPSLDEIKWAARDRRRRRHPQVPQPRQELRHSQGEEREPADVPATLVDDVLETTISEAAVAEDVVAEDTVVEDTVAEDTVVDDVTAEPEPSELVLPEAQALPAVIVLPEAELAEAVQVAEPEPAPAPAAAVAEPLFVDDDADRDFFDRHDPELPELRPWRPAVLPDEAPVDSAEPSWLPELVVDASPTAVEPEPEAEPEPELMLEAEPIPSAEDDEDGPPLVSQVLVVREPAPVDPGRIAVLDEVMLEAPTITRLVPLPSNDALAVAAPGSEDDLLVPLDDSALDDSGLEDSALDDSALDDLADGDARTAPLYWRLLRLHHTRPNGWLRALFFEGSVALAVVLVLAEAASVWTIVVLPLVVAIVVKANDVLAGNLRRAYRQPKRRKPSS